MISEDPYQTYSFHSNDRKRKESDPRTKCLLNNAEVPSHHPMDPVEMRRINFQTPGKDAVTVLSVGTVIII